MTNEEVSQTIAIATGRTIEDVRAKREVGATAPAPQSLRAEGPRDQHTTQSPPPPTPRTDPLDSIAELRARVEALWAELLRVTDEERELVRVECSKGVLRTALIRAQRDAAHRALDAGKAVISDVYK